MSVFVCVHSFGFSTQDLLILKTMKIFRRIFLSFFPCHK